MPRAVRRSVCASLFALVVAFVLTTVGSDVALAQVQSTVDTMRIVPPPSMARGEEVEIDIRLRVVDTLGAFAYRLRYDTAVFEPVQDTFQIGNDTVVGIIALDLHPGHFEQFAGSVREPGVIVFLGADMDLDTSSLCLPGSFLAVGMLWRVRPNAPLGPSPIYFENDPVLPATWNAFSDWWGDDFVRPVFVDAPAFVTCGCQCFAEAGECDGDLNVVDVLAVVNIAFRGSASSPDPNPLCPVTRTDVNCDGFTTIVDVIKVIEVAFRGADPTATFCNPCE